MEKKWIIMVFYEFFITFNKKMLTEIDGEG